MRGGTFFSDVDRDVVQLLAVARHEDFPGPFLAGGTGPGQRQLFHAQAGVKLGGLPGRRIRRQVLGGYLVKDDSELLATEP